MLRGIVVSLFGFVGLIASGFLSLEMEAHADLGPCSPYAGGYCFCASMGDGSGAYFYCQDHQCTRMRCDNVSGPCEDTETKCYDNFHTNKVWCPSYPCMIGCTPI